MGIPSHVLYRLVLTLALSVVIASARPELGLQAAALATFVPQESLATIPPEPWVLGETTGRIEVRRPGGPPEAWRRIRRGGSLQPGSAVRTGERGRVVITRGQDVILLDSGTAIELGASSPDHVKLLHQYGNALYEVLPRPDRRFQVVAPHLVVTAEGTAFSVILEQDSTAVAVSDGHVALHVTFTGERVDLATGHLALLGGPMDRLEVHPHALESRLPLLRHESSAVRRVRRGAGRLVQRAAADGLGAPSLYDFAAGTFREAGRGSGWLEGLPSGEEEPGVLRSSARD